MITVMLVDDEELIRAGISSMVPWQQHNLQLVYQAKHGLEALEYLLKTPVDIVITDIKMPVMDGLELVRQACENGLNTHFIMLTGFDEFEYARTAMRYNVKHYLLKPCNESDILQACMEAVADIATEEAREWEHSALARGAAQNFMLHYLVQGSCTNKDFAYYSAIINPQGHPFCLVLFRCDSKDTLVDYALTNVAHELFDSAVLYSFSLPEHIILFLCTGEQERLHQQASQVAGHILKLHGSEYTIVITPPTNLEGMPAVYWQALENRSVCHSYQDSCVNDIISIVENNLHDPGLNLKWIARNKLYMNENYLSKLFIRVTGMRFTQYLTDQRISRAKKMIQDNPGIKLVTLCNRLGFANNPSYFSTLFKNQTGQTLTDYRSTLFRTGE